MAKLKTQWLTNAKLMATRLLGKILEDDSEIIAFCTFIARDYIAQRRIFEDRMELSILSQM